MICKECGTEYFWDNDDGECDEELCPDCYASWEEALLFVKV
jgi:hypothetical protein